MLVNRLSPSMIIEYNNCPLSFYYKYVAKIHLPTKQIHLVFGTAVHAAIEEIYEGRDPFKAFDFEFKKEKLLEEEQNKYDEFYKLGEEMIRNYQVAHPSLDKLYDLQEGTSEIYFREHMKNPITGQLSTLPLAGRIDRLTKSGKVVEYKTSKMPWKTDGVSFKVQTLLYNLWYYTMYNRLPEETLYIILLKQYKNVGKGEVIQTLSNHSTLNELASIFEEVETVVQRIEGREFKRPTGFHPKWCDCWRYEELLRL